MSELSLVKIECPACGQHYSLELGDEETSVTCAHCNAEFTACRTEELVESGAMDTRAPRSERLMAFLLRCGKTSAGWLAVLSLLGMLLGAAGFVRSFRGGIEVPTYAQLGAPTGGNSATDTESPTDIEKQYGGDLAVMIKKHALENGTYAELLVVIRQLDKEFRAAYVAGLERALDDAAQATAHKTPAMDVVRLYSGAFDQARQNALKAKTAADRTRRMALAAVGFSGLLLILMLMIPVLVKIEENTRAKTA